jgi:DNA-binding NtrC family response regulator
MIAQPDLEESAGLVRDPAADNAPPQVLVVDDSKQTRDYVVWLLTASGYRALAAENGLAAQLLLVAIHPTLIVSSLDMPLGNGWELLVFCHRNYPEIPVLLMPDESLGRHTKIESLAAGVMDRSFDFRSFRFEVERLISRVG